MKNIFKLQFRSIVCSSLAALTLMANPGWAAGMQAANVMTAQGVVKGRVDGDVVSWKGIPYAGAPVGEYRWRPTRPASRWEGVRDAGEFGAVCPQVPWSPGGTPSMPANASEDCLFLNIWRPADANSEDRLPVMVWIHGGAFVFGSSSEPWYDGAAFAREGVILVSFNYRLGRLGFFAFPSLSDESPDEYKGNYGYMDQVAALQWVQENIEAFGGDKNNVTIFGESAGGVSVHTMLSIADARGLFAKAIIESGGGRDGVLTGRPLSADNADPHYPISAETIGVNFARKHGIEGTDADALAALRKLDFVEVLDGGAETYGADKTPIYSGPIVDGQLVTRTAEQAYRQGDFNAVPLMIGNNSAEVPGGFVNATSRDDLQRQFGKELIAAYDPDGDMAFAELLTLINTDRVWAEPARFTARAFVKQGQPAYVYLFSYVAESMRSHSPLGAAHASEIPYVFNTLNAAPIKGVSDGDQHVATRMHRYWANFAKSGDPNGAGLPTWPAYATGPEGILEFEPDEASVGKRDPRTRRLDAMASTY